MEYDEIIIQTGGFGRYQRRILFLLALAVIPSGFHGMVGVFLGAQPNFRCLLPFESSENATYQLPADFMDAAYPWDDKAGSWSQCARYDLNYTEQDYDSVENFTLTTSTIKCDAFVYDKKTYQLTTTTEFNLVCDNAWVKATADAMFMVGNMLGALIFGALSDRYGRKPTYLSTITVNVVCGFLVAFSPETISYVIVRLILGASVNAMYLISYVNAVEMVLPEKRMMIGVCVQMFFACGYVFVTGFAYFITNWRMLQIAITIPSLAFLGYWWLIPESARWLLSKGRLDEAKELILKVSSENGVKLSEQNLDDMLTNNSSTSLPDPDSKKPSVLDLFRYPNLRRKSLILLFNWFVNNTTYYGLSWNTSSLGGNDYLNFALAATVEIPANVFLFFTLNRWGRKIILCGCTMFAGLSLLSIVFIPIDMQWLVIFLAMVGKLAITASFQTAYVFSAEQYPTVIRNVAVGSCSGFARIGGIIAPYIIYSSSTWTPLPFVIFGTGLLVTGLTALLLPETLNRKLPESIEDGEAFGKGKVISNCDSYQYDTRRPRKQKLQFNEPHNAAMFDGKADMTINAFFVIIDKLKTELTRRASAYSDLHNLFGFLQNFRHLSPEELRKNAERLYNAYTHDLAPEFMEKCVHFKEFIVELKSDGDEIQSPLDFLKSIREKNIVATFPNIDTALKIFLTILPSNASGE